MKPPAPNKRVAGTIQSEAIMRSRSLTIDVLVLRGHTRRAATHMVAHLQFPEE